MAQLVRRQIGRFLGALASPATCFMQRKLSPKSKSVAYAQKSSIPNATQSLKSAKKSCFYVVIRLKTSQNKKNMQPFTSYQDKNVVLDTPDKIPRLNRPIFPHTVEILYLFGILRINTRVSGMLADTPARLSAGAAQEYQKDIKSPLETIPPFIVK